MSAALHAFSMPPGSIKDMLAQQIANWQCVGHPALIERFVLRNGREFKPAPLMGRRGTPKECFRNAAVRAPAVGGRYVEGFGYRPGLILIQHAWVAVEHGYAMDPTWDRPEECLYFGVPFDEVVWQAEQDRLGYYGLLDTPTGINVRFLFERDPGLAEELAEANPAWARIAERAAR